VHKSKVSILITNYNKSKYLNRCIKSCQNQSYKNIEIIFVDDKSTDNSIEVAKKFKKIKIFKTKFRTNFPALNQINAVKLGLKYCSGKTIFLLDSDDFFFKNKLMVIMNYFNLQIKKKLFCDIPKVHYSNNVIHDFHIKKKKSRSVWPTVLPTSCIALKKSFLNECLKNIFIKEKKFKYLELDFRISVYARNLKNQYNIIKKNLTCYFQHPEGIMSNYKKFSRNWWIKRFQAHLFVKLFNKKNNINYEITYDYLVTFFVYFLIKNFLVRSLIKLCK